MRIKDMITLDESNWYKFQQILPTTSTENV